MELSSPPAPLVSIIVPTRNRAALTQELFDSIWKLDFDFSRLEIVVSDNCSTDGVPAVLHALAAQAPCRMHLLEQTRNIGPAGSRNAAVARATGEFLAFVDNDCRVDPGWLRELLAGFENERVGFVSGAVLNKPEQKLIFMARFRPGTAVEHPSYPTENIMYRRAVWLQFGGFNEQLCYNDFLGRPNECADTDLAWNILEGGYTYRFAARAIVYHEVEMQGLQNWLMEPFRLFVVPELVRRHPELRERMLYKRLFFYPGSVRFYIAVLLIPVGLYFLHFWGVLVVVIGFLLLRILKRALLDRKSPYSTREWLLLAGRQAIMSAGLIYGSIRFRCLVL